MLAILENTAPFFLIILAGYIAVRRHWLPLESIAGLNAFVLYFALPCMLFRFGAQIQLAQLLQPAIWLVYGSAAFCLIPLAMAWGRKDWGWNDSAFGALVTTFPNTGFLGLPLLLSLLGATAATPIIATILFDLVFTSSVCIAFSRLGAHESTAFKSIIKGVISNPLPWSILLGIAYALQPWALFPPVLSMLDLLGVAASPVALFTIGAIIGRAALRAQIAQQLSLSRLHRSDYLPLALLKLFLHPLLIVVFGLIAIDQGLQLSYQTLTILVLIAALPSASNVALLSERYGAYTVRVAYVVLASTVLSFASFTLIAQNVLTPTA